MPYKNKLDLYAAQKRHREKIKAERDAMVYSLRVIGYKKLKLAELNEKLNFIYQMEQ